MWVHIVDEQPAYRLRHTPGGLVEFALELDYWWQPSFSHCVAESVGQCEAMRSREASPLELFQEAEATAIFEQT